jgi:hypothetical protein
MILSRHDSVISLLRKQRPLNRPPQTLTHPKQTRFFAFFRSVLDPEKNR